MKGLIIYSYSHLGNKPRYLPKWMFKQLMRSINGFSMEYSIDDGKTKESIRFENG